VGLLKTTLKTLQLDQLNPFVDEKIAGRNVDGLEPPIFPDPVSAELLPDDSVSLISYPDALQFLVNSTPFKRFIISTRIL
jgi:hypothetical protein